MGMVADPMISNLKSSFGNTIKLLRPYVNENNQIFNQIKKIILFLKKIKI